MATCLYTHIHSYPGHARVYKVSTWIILTNSTTKGERKNHYQDFQQVSYTSTFPVQNTYFTPAHTQVYTAKAEHRRSLSETMKSFLLSFSSLFPLNFRNVQGDQNDGSSVAVETTSVLLHVAKQTIRQGPRCRAWGFTITQPKCVGQVGNIAA